MQYWMDHVPIYNSLCMIGYAKQKNLFQVHMSLIEKYTVICNGTNSNLSNFGQVILDVLDI